MSSSMTNYFGNAVLTYYFYGKTIYLACLVADPGVTGSFVDEVAGGSYERQKYTATAPSNKSVGNSNVIVFDNMPSCTVNWVALCDLQFGGNMLLRGQLTTPQVLPNSARLTITASDVVWTL